MPKESKKRKLDSSSAASPSGSLSTDTKHLKQALRKPDSFVVVQSLSNALDNMPPETVRMLKEVLTPIFQAENELQHCVRCHQTFPPGRNTNSSCVVRCEANSDVEAGKYHSYMFDCCGKMRYGEDMKKGLVCYTAKHTINPKDVKYYRDYNDKQEKEKGLNYSGDNPNVRTCKAMGCEIA
ncbi:hypothetical protein FRC08_000103 [Ceratobasidium sp. 394]|nr:hypothetical protein FRC08_000103 [Ceratobasidium sp. 394]KAG9087773.1 hypothetical protein FS749_002653 [Ceratobasidium sp. UAMH 11750]